MTPLIEESAIRTRVEEMGREIAADYRGRPLTILGVLTGSIVLLADLVRRIDLPLRVGLIQASSYRGQATAPGPLRVNAELVPDIADRDVLLVDDVFDTGQTMAALLQTVRAMSPESVRCAVLLWKEARSRVNVRPDYHGFLIPDMFVVGYGLDYNDEHRHLPYIAALEAADL
ncbi:MAG: hypoxanthine phosphoribosyltransferase [Planctomycetaceae bacterium]